MAPPFSNRKETAAVLHPPLFLSSLALSFLGFSLPIFGKALDANAFTIGGLYAVFTVTTTVLRPAVGWALDHYGRKRFFVSAI